MQSVSDTRPWLKSYSEEVSSTEDYPRDLLQTFLINSASSFPNSIALEFEGMSIPYKKLNELANQFANGLISLGMKKGSKIAIILPNTPQFVFCFFGALKIGAVVVPTNPSYRDREIEFQLQDSEAETVVILNDVDQTSDSYSEFQKARARLRKIKHVIVTSLFDFLSANEKRRLEQNQEVQTLKPETINLLEFLNQQPDSEPPPMSMNAEEEVAVLQYTGGTTGISKGAMLTHYNLSSNAVMLKEWIKATQEEKLLAVTPFFHIYGLTFCMILPIYVGQEIVVLPTFRSIEVLKLIHKRKISIFPGVPAMFIALLNSPDLGKYSIRTAKKCISGGAPLPLEVWKKFDDVTGGHLVEGYGLTEASPVTHCNPIGDGAIVKSGSIGIPLPNTDAKIVNPESGDSDLMLGETGELAVRGPQVMKGYWKRQDETENVLKGGWLMTGDIARMDNNGFFYIVDRKKDLINSSGFKVWPREVEEVLFMHPNVREAAVVGVKDPYGSETVKAFIVLKDKNSGVDAEGIRAFCRPHLVAYKVPRIIEFRDYLPKTLVGKLLRRKLREEI